MPEVCFVIINKSANHMLDTLYYKIGDKVYYIINNIIQYIIQV